jgi:hypothetical protein
VDLPVLGTHRLGGYRDWRASVEYAYRIGRELDRARFPQANRADPAKGSG